MSQVPARRTLRRSLLIAVAVVLIATTGWAPRAFAHAGAEQLYFEDFQIQPAQQGYELTAHLIDFSTGVGALGFGVVASLTPTGGGHPIIYSLIEEQKGRYGGHIDALPGQYTLKLSGRQVPGGIAGTPDDQTWNITLSATGSKSQAPRGHSEFLLTIIPIVVGAAVLAVLIRSRRRRKADPPAPSNSSDSLFGGEDGDDDSADLLRPLARKES